MPDIVSDGLPPECPWAPPIVMVVETDVRTPPSAMRWTPGTPALRFNTFTPPYIRAGTR